MRLQSTLLCLLLASASASAQEASFSPLFDGQSLAGWTRRGGQAQYIVLPEAPGGAQIVGVACKDCPNTFLCTDKEYGDFVLEFEVKVDPPLNSGVQFRSACYDEPTEFENTNEDGSQNTIKINAGRVHGYQVEIDPSARAWSGGVYDEARRGWLFNLEGHEDARQAFDKHGWNHYRVEAIGDHIKTTLNGVPAADFTDDVAPSGFIALQVHSIGSPDQAGMKIRWRNIRISER